MYIVDKGGDPHRSLFHDQDCFVKGTGMGLALAHRIVTSHNGAITVHSEPGKGTVILTTGFSETVTPEKAKKVGICDYIMKPVVARDLGKAIRGVLDG